MTSLFAGLMAESKIEYPRLAMHDSPKAAYVGRYAVENGDGA